ncbi:single-stranded DNA-binding protein [Mycoplasmopsis columbinasalis]|uniref:Putative single-stranded DNA-binding protein n=1 Tax=Mycoplasmopsis columbinasalis TaxID=114880 RepID=A0A449BAM7_9BACT|nr:single-stranded DNA-binding protein [Mycoplasmopsis columbinasalis]VEU78254.1 putative single-stranded DNA-binding protein [Mycoplasmopsis columbinasalis]
MNKVLLTGKIVSDKFYETTYNKGTVLKFILNVANNYYLKNNNNVEITLFGNLANRFKAKAIENDEIEVLAGLKSTSYVNADNVRKYFYEIVAKDIIFSKDHIPNKYSLKQEENLPKENVNLLKNETNSTNETVTVESNFKLPSLDETVAQESESK